MQLNESCLPLLNADIVLDCEVFFKILHEEQKTPILKGLTTLNTQYAFPAFCGVTSNTTICPQMFRCVALSDGIRHEMAPPRVSQGGIPPS